MLSIAIIIIISFGMWKLHAKGVNIKWYSLGGMLAAIVISIVISVRQHWAHILVPLYAIAKGFFLGAITVYAHAKFPNLPYQAIGITVGLATWGLLVTLVWLYMEVLRLMRKLAIRF